MNNHQIPKVGILLIGDELLSGKTRDVNVQQIAQKLGEVGVDVAQCIIVADKEESIVAACNELRAKYDYVFTTGGIGPTHDDITIDAIAKAFEVEVYEHPEAVEKFLTRYTQEEFTPARKRMARAPIGASLIANDVTLAPGFRMENVFIMAGVPSVCATMIQWVVENKQIAFGRIMHERTIATTHRESDIAKCLGLVESKFDDVSIGSYPRMVDGKFSTRVILRSREIDDLHRASQEIVIALDDLPWPGALNGIPAPEKIEGGHKIEITGYGISAKSNE